MNTIRIEDVQYGEVNGIPLLLDIVRPNPIPSNPMPVIVYIHGGGWNSGDKAKVGGMVWNSFFAQYGFFAVSINYRLSSEAIFPAQIYDCKAAVRWIRANAKELKINPDQIGVWGHSAGGHLAALLGTSGNLPELEGNSGSPNYPSHVNAVVTSAAPIDILKMGGWHDLPNSHEAQLVGGITVHDRTELAQMANLINYIQEKNNVPPFLIIHGEQDEVVPSFQSEMLYNALENVSLLKVKGADHGPDGGNVLMDDILQFALTFFKRHLLEEKPNLEEVEQYRKQFQDWIKQCFEAGRVI